MAAAGQQQGTSSPADPAEAPAEEEPVEPTEVTVDNHVYAVGDYVHIYARQGKKGTKTYGASWYVGKIRAFKNQGAEVHLQHWLECVEEDGQLTGAFCPMPANMDFCESVHSIGPVNKQSEVEHDDETDETWIWLDVKGMEEAVAADLRAEEKDDAAKRGQSFYGGGARRNKRKRKKSTPKGKSDDVKADEDEDKKDEDDENEEQQPETAACTQTQRARIQVSDDDY